MAVFFIFIQNISPLQGVPLGLDLLGHFGQNGPKLHQNYSGQNSGEDIREQSNFLGSGEMRPVPLLGETLLYTFFFFFYDFAFKNLICVMCKL